MGPDLQITTNTSQRLLVSSPQMFFWSGTYLFVVFETVASIVVARLLPATRGGLRSLLYLVPLSGILILFFAFGWTNVLDIHWDTGITTSTNRSLLGFSQTSTIPLGDVEHAIIDYDRMGPRIGLTLRSGGVLLPLGRISMYKPSQYLVVDAINAGLGGRTPVSPTGASSTPAPGSFDLGAGKMVQKEREFEQKLKDHKQERQP